MTQHDSEEIKPNHGEYTEDPIDTLTKKSAQLFAMLVTVSGEGFESFEFYNDTIKQNYLWACADMARDIKALSSQVACGQSASLRRAALVREGEKTH